jgi:hypothetical protein
MGGTVKKPGFSGHGFVGLEVWSLVKEINLVDLGYFWRNVTFPFFSLFARTNGPLHTTLFGLVIRPQPICFPTMSRVDHLLFVRSGTTDAVVETSDWREPCFICVELQL